MKKIIYTDKIEYLSDSEKLFSYIEEFDFDSYQKTDKVKSAVLKSIEIYYQNHTAKETCDAFGIVYTPQIVKLLHRLFPKGMGWGGARRKSKLP